MATLLEVLKKATAFLEGKGSDSPRLDAEVLIAHGLSVRRIDLYLQHDRPLTEAEVVRLRGLVVERGRGVPVAHLTGEREFFSLSFHVTKDVLVPRPETEGLVEAGLAFLESREAPVVCDVGTGSGCVAIALLVRRPDARALATDVSPAALEVAAANARRHGVADRVTFALGPWLEPVARLRAAGDAPALAAVLSNPPYVVRGDPSIEAGVAAFEPAQALYVAGRDALEPAKAIAREALALLSPGGLLAVEVGAGSASAAGEALAAMGYEDVGAAVDGAGVLRVVSGRSPPARA
jgi:release factor glutamine methyltransferase